MANEDVLNQVEILAGNGGTLKDWQYVACNLAAALREAREDTRMLDFIEDCGVPGLAWESRMSTTGRGYRLHQHALGNGVHATARDAIDAAMKPPGGEGSGHE